MYEEIILHIHGGGFLAMSSFSHQSYTREWVNSLDIPLFSVDYRLAPEYAFPAAVEDVYDFYLFIIQNKTTLFRNLNIKRIILAGDSAGGNLAFVLTMLLITNKLQLPDALFL